VVLAYFLTHFYSQQLLRVALYIQDNNKGDVEKRNLRKYVFYFTKHSMDV